MARIIVVTSGKGGVDKTTTAAALAMGLAEKGLRTTVIDFDVGLRNLDLIMGCEPRVVYDFVNDIQGEAKLNQALIKDKRNENLFILPASQTRDKEALTKEGVGKVLEDLSKEFEYIVCDSPAGIEIGATMAMYYADDAFVVTNPEVSSVRDSDRMIGILSSKSRRAEQGQEAIPVSGRPPAGQGVDGAPPLVVRPFRVLMPEHLAGHGTGLAADALVEIEDEGDLPRVSVRGGRNRHWGILLSARSRVACRPALPRPH